ncbi:hypothetical protein AOLI_G00290830 [Acnodon oligacanthus]
MWGRNGDRRAQRTPSESITQALLKATETGRQIHERSFQNLPPGLLLMCHINGQTAFKGAELKLLFTDLILEPPECQLHC